MGSGAGPVLAERGFQLDPEYGLMAMQVSQTFSTEEEFVAYVVDFLRLIGAADGMVLIAYP